MSGSCSSRLRRRWGCNFRIYRKRHALAWERDPAMTRTALAGLNHRTAPVTMREKLHDEEGKLVLQDDGMGLPPHLSWMETPSMGWHLVKCSSDSCRARQKWPALPAHRSQSSFRCKDGAGWHEF